MKIHMRKNATLNRLKLSKRLKGLTDAYITIEVNYVYT